MRSNKPYSVQPTCDRSLPTAAVTTTIARADYNKLDTLAKKLNTNKSALVRKLIMEAIDNNKKIS